MISFINNPNVTINCGGTKTLTSRLIKLSSKRIYCWQHRNTAMPQLTNITTVALIIISDEVIITEIQRLVPNSTVIVSNNRLAWACPHNPKITIWFMFIISACISAISSLIVINLSSRFKPNHSKFERKQSAQSGLN